MTLYFMVLKDIIRRKKRVLYAALGVVIGTMTVVAILTAAIAGEARIVAQLEKYGPNLTIVPAINNLDMKLGDLSMGTLTVGENYISDAKIAEIQKIADDEIKKALDIKDEGEIAIVAPRLYVTANVRETSLMLVGINPTPEWTIRTWWQVKDGEKLESGNQVLAGATAASLLGLKVGDSVNYNGTDFNITGVMGETGGAEDYQLFVPLAALQPVAGKDGLISSIDLRALCNACPVEDIAKAINSTIPGVRAVAVKSIAHTEMGMLDRINKFMLVLGGITLLVGCFGVANTMLTSVHERIKDIGIMRAAGASQRQILFMFLEEALVVGLTGGIAGYFAGSFMAYFLGPIIFDGASVAFVPGYFPVSLAIAVAVAVVAAAYPAFKATRIKVADSFRSI